LSVSFRARSRGGRRETTRLKAGRAGACVPGLRRGSRENSPPGKAPASSPRPGRHGRFVGFRGLRQVGASSSIQSCAGHGRPGLPGWPFFVDHEGPTTFPVGRLRGRDLRRAPGRPSRTRGAGMRFDGRPRRRGMSDPIGRGTHQDHGREARPRPPTVVANGRRTGPRARDDLSGACRGVRRGFPTFRPPWRPPPGRPSLLARLGTGLCSPPSRAATGGTLEFPCTGQLRPNRFRTSPGPLAVEVWARTVEESSQVARGAPPGGPGRHGHGVPGCGLPAPTVDFFFFVRLQAAPRSHDCGAAGASVALRGREGRAMAPRREGVGPSAHARGQPSFPARPGPERRIILYIERGPTGRISLPCRAKKGTCSARLAERNAKGEGSGRCGDRRSPNDGARRSAEALPGAHVKGIFEPNPRAGGAPRSGSLQPRGYSGGGLEEWLRPGG